MTVGEQGWSKSAGPYANGQDSSKAWIPHRSKAEDIFIGSSGVSGTVIYSPIMLVLCKNNQGQKN